MATIMEGLDAVSGSLAECYITIDEKRYNFMQLIKFESKMEKSISEVPILGRTGKGHKATSWNGSWTGTAHYNQSVLRQLMFDYKAEGLDKPFTIQVTNLDPTTGVGKQTIIHNGCLISAGTLAKFDASAEYLDEEISGTFDDFEIREKEKFELLKGMEEN